MFILREVKKKQELVGKRLPNTLVWQTIYFIYIEKKNILKICNVLFLDS
jgi:hypothetical protein